jgi:hypothetical protein
MFTATVNSIHDGSTLNDGINVAKQELVAGPWYADRALNITGFAAALKSLTAAASPVSLVLAVGTQAQFTGGANGLPLTARQIDLSAAFAGDPAADKLSFSEIVLQGDWFCVYCTTTDTTGYTLTVTLSAEAV